MVEAVGVSIVASRLSYQPHSSTPPPTPHAHTAWGAGLRMPQWRGLRHPHWWQPHDLPVVLATKGRGALDTKENPEASSALFLGPGLPTPQILATTIPYKLLDKDKMLAHLRSIQQTLEQHRHWGPQCPCS